MAVNNVFAKLDAALHKQRTTLVRDPDMFTTKEYSTSAGVSTSVARDRLLALFGQGTIIRARVPQLQSNNRIQVVDGWKFLGKSAEMDTGPGGTDRKQGSNVRDSKRGRNSSKKSSTLA